MPPTKPDAWLLSYSDSRSSTRLLVSLPVDMLRDLHLIAKARAISASELVRRVVTEHIADEIRARPEIAASFRGSLRNT